MWVGKPFYTLEGDYELETGMMGIAEINYTQSPEQAISSANWDRSGQIESINGGIVLAKYWASSTPGSGTVDLTLSNACGSLFKYFNVNVTGGKNWYKSYPNPTQDFLIVELDGEKIPENLKAQEVELRIYDKLMALKKRKSFFGNSTTLNLSDLKSGVYILQIEINNEIFEDKIIVSKK